MMPHQWRLLLQPSSPAYTPRVTPAQLHGLACALFEGAGADHHRQNKPFRVTPLIHADEGDGDPPSLAALHLGWLDDHTVPAMEKLTGTRVRLGAQFFTVRHVHATAVPYAALREHPPARRAVFDFHSATYFSRRGRWLPLPDPVLLYTSLIRRWQHFAPAHLTLNTERTSALLDTVALAAHEIRSVPVDLEPGLRIGFTGHAAITLGTAAADAATPDIARTFAALSRYAQIAGVGAQTTHGLGWATVHLDTRPGGQTPTATSSG